VIIELLPTIEEDPELRHAGSFTNVLEEYVEAKLFQTWLLGNKDSSIEHTGESPESPSGSLLKLSEFELIPLEPDEYLGGLCDLTGEVGRYAVQRGTLRDSKGVQFCLSTNLSILFAMESLKRFPGQIGKKMGALRNSVEKLEKMLYELSLVEATGRNYVAASNDNSHDD
jgi:predicted translin family RNA/ssDNA-binding protein